MLKLEKWHSIGNDFIIIDKKIPTLKIQQLCNRNFGIGADQLIVLEGKKAYFFNANGEEAELCGNALKCIGEIVFKKTGEKNFDILTQTKIVSLSIEEDKLISIDIGRPNIVEMLNENDFFVDLGNPHYISILQDYEEEFFNSDLITQKLHQEGAIKQKEFASSGGINFSLVCIKDKQNLLVRTFERGVGETLSCGSGSCAAFISCIERKLINSEVFVFNKGSKKVLDFKESFHFISYRGTKNIALKGRGTKIADILVKY